MSANKFTLFRTEHDQAIHVIQDGYWIRYAGEVEKQNKAEPDKQPLNIKPMPAPFTQGADAGTSIMFNRGIWTSVIFINEQFVSFDENNCISNGIFPISGNWKISNYWHLPEISEKMLVPAQLHEELLSLYDTSLLLELTAPVFKNEIYDAQAYYRAIKFDQENWYTRYLNDPIAATIQYIDNNSNTILSNEQEKLDKAIEKIHNKIQQLINIIREHELTSPTTSGALYNTYVFHAQHRIPLSSILRASDEFLKNARATVMYFTSTIEELINNSNEKKTSKSILSNISTSEQLATNIETNKKNILEDLCTRHADNTVNDLNLSFLDPDYESTLKRNLRNNCCKEIFGKKINRNAEHWKEISAIILIHLYLSELSHGERSHREDIQFKKLESAFEHNFIEPVKIFFDNYISALQLFYKNLVDYKDMLKGVKFIHQQKSHIKKAQNSLNTFRNKEYIQNIQQWLTLNDQMQLSGIDAIITINGGYSRLHPMTRVSEPLHRKEGTSILFRNRLVILQEHKSTRIREIKDLWPQTPVKFHNGIDAAILRDNNKIELLKDHDSTLVDIPGINE